MGNKEFSMAQRLRIAGTLIALGLIAELLTLAWNNPISFIVFLAIGGLLMFAGIVLYLWSVLSDGQRTPHVSHNQLGARATHSN